VIVILAVDIKRGKCVRLLQGRFEDETIFSDDPAAMAGRWADQGAGLIHVVDLDGAFARRPQNLFCIKEIIKKVDASVQVGGGIRDIETIRSYFDIGAKRVIIGTAAIINPGLATEACELFPGRIVLGIDARDGFVAIDGWTETTAVKAVDLAKQFEEIGIAGINFTDIEKDGMECGPNVEETKKLAEAVSVPVIASGGVSSIEDIESLLPLEKSGVIGVITGKALYSGALNLKEATALAESQSSGRQVL